MKVFDRHDHYAGNVYPNGEVRDRNDNYVGMVYSNGDVHNRSGYVGSVSENGKISGTTKGGHIYADGSVNNSSDNPAGKVSGIGTFSSPEDRIYAGGAALLLLLDPTVTRKTELPPIPSEREPARGQAEALREQAQLALDRKAKPYGYIAGFGGILFIIGAIVAFAGSNFALLIMGALIGGIGLGGTFIFSTMALPVKAGCLGIPLGVVLLSLGLGLGAGGLTTLGIVIGVLGLALALVSAIAQGFIEDYIK